MLFRNYFPPLEGKAGCIPGQLNITVECVPVDFSSKNLHIANKPKRLRLNLRVFILLMFIYFSVPGLSCSTWPLSCGMWDLVPWLVIEPRPPALRALNYQVFYLPNIFLEIYMVYLFPRAAVRKYYKLGGLKQQIFSCVSRGWKSKSRCRHGHALSQGSEEEFLLPSF